MEIKVVKNVLKSNEDKAAENRRRMDVAGVLAVNLMSSPGSGKTTLLEKTIAALAPSRCAVMVGDLQTSRDAERLAADAVEVVQINTGKGCHLSAEQVSAGLDALALEDISYLFIENVGNMVCPTAFDLGEHLRAALLSTPEGEDKVAKYPVLFQRAHVILLTKIDLIGALGFNKGTVKADLSRVNTEAPLIELSAATGDGLGVWLEWLASKRTEIGK